VAEQVPRLVRLGRPGGKVLWYWRPSRTLRGQGWGDRRLDDDPAIAQSEARRINAEVERWRLARARGREGRAPVPGTVHALIAAYRGHDDFLLLAPSTRHRYLQCLDAIGAELGRERLKTITPPVVQAFKRLFRAVPAQANQHLAVLRLLFSFGIREGLVVTPHPARGYRQYRTRPREVVWSHEQEAAFLAVAVPGMALAVRLALYTAQREGDVLALPWSAYDGRRIRLVQGKTGRRLEIPVAVPLQLALDAAPRRSPLVCVRPDGQPWRADHFRHVFARTRAAAGLPATLWFMDLRRTAIVRLAEAGCTIPEIASVSGHGIDYCQRIIDRYLPRTRALAQAAVIKLDRSQTPRPRDSNAG
jgi:integrase